MPKEGYSPPPERRVERPDPPPAGPRKSTSEKKWHRPFLAALAETGNVTRSAEIAGVERTICYRDRREREEFAEAWADAIEQATDTLEEEARRRALEGVTKPIYQGGKLVGHELRYSDTLMIFLLKAHRPKKFRDNVRIEHASDPDTEWSFTFRKPHEAG